MASRLACSVATLMIAFVSLSPAFVVAAMAQEIDYSHSAYDAIVIEPSQGNVHISGTFEYGTSFPTSGQHAPTPAAPGFYEEGLSPEVLVHALEHGNIVIYYDEPGEKALAWVRRWTNGYQGTLDGVIAVRQDGLGLRIVLTAWERRLELDRLDSRGAYFVDAFRGRGPERRVR